MKLIIASWGVLALVSCGAQKEISAANPTEYGSTITSSELKNLLHTFL